MEPRPEVQLGLGRQAGDSPNASEEDCLHQRHGPIVRRTWIVNYLKRRGAGIGTTGPATILRDEARSDRHRPVQSQRLHRSPE
jgi:hypothetical protein